MIISNAIKASIYANHVETRTTDLINLGPNTYYNEEMLHDPDRGIFTQRLGKMAQHRSHTMLSLPCKDMKDPEEIEAEPTPFGANKPNPGNQRSSRRGLGFNLVHPTDNPLLHQSDPFDPSHLVNLAKVGKLRDT